MNNMHLGRQISNDAPAGGEELANLDATEKREEPYGVSRRAFLRRSAGTLGVMLAPRQRSQGRRC